MKKVIIPILMLALLLLWAPALAAPGDAILFSQTQRTEMGLGGDDSAIAAVADTLYIFTEQKIFTWKLGEEKPTLAASDVPSARMYSTMEDAAATLKDQADYATTTIFTWDGKLYGINGLNGFVYPLTIAEGKVNYGEPVKLAWDNMTEKDGDYAYTRAITRLTVMDGKLYTLIRSYNENYDKPTLAAFDLTTGEKQVFDSAAFVQDITPYKDGKLLARVFDASTAYEGEQKDWKKPTLAVFDPAAGTLTTVAEFETMDIFGLCYSSENDTLYYAIANQVRMMPGLGAPQQAAYLVLQYASEGNVALLPGGMYVIPSWEGIFVCNTDPQFLPTVKLSAYGLYADDTAMAFSAAHPEVALTFNQNVYFDSPETLAQAMVSADQSFDLYQLSLSYEGFTSLMEKGYCADLSNIPALSEQVAQMYPFLQDAVKKDGKLFAVPSQLWGYGLCYSKTNWEEAGIPMEKLPTTYKEFLDLLVWWAEEGKDEYPGYQFLEGTSDYNLTLTNKTIDAYIQYYQSIKQDLTFDTDLFRKLMTAVESVETEEIDIATDNDPMALAAGKSMAMSEELYEKPALFMDYYDWLSVGSGNDYATPLPLPLDEGLPLGIGAYVQVIFINPNSPNFDMAVEYITTYLAHMQKSIHIAMFPNDNEPVRNPDFESWMANWEAELAKMKTQLETAAPEEKKDLETNIQWYEKALANRDQYAWSVSAESIARYRELAQYAFATGENILNYNSKEGASEIQTLLQRYTDGQLPLEQFIREINNKVRRIQMERQ